MGCLCEKVPKNNNTLAVTEKYSTMDSGDAEPL